MLPSAGEVEQFAYCRHNWWLARQGVDGEGDGVARGMREHARKSKVQERAERERRETTRALRWMFYVLGAAGSTTFLTLELVLLRSNPHHWIFLATALVLVAASAALLVIASIQERAYRRDVVDAGLVPGTVSQQGLRGEGVMRDDELDLRGSPDYVMDTDGGPVPVEVKTGRTPPKPFPSHKLQLACYMHLLEAGGQRPPYGLLTYPDGVFRVDWDERMQKRLRSTLRAMQRAEEQGKADRDHDHAGRCRGCARRAACDQSLV